MVFSFEIRAEMILHKLAHLGFTVAYKAVLTETMPTILLFISFQPIDQPFVTNRIDGKRREGE